MKLGIWHCKVLYAMSDWGITKIAKLAEVSADLLIQEARSGEWAEKREQFSTMPDIDKEDLGKLELLLGKFQSDPGKLEWVNGLIAKIKQKKEREDSQKIVDQCVAKLSEFGVDKSNAEDIIAEIQRSLANNNDELIESHKAEVSIRDKVDAVNNGYSILASGQNQAIAESHEILRDTIQFFGDCFKDIKRTRPSSASFEELMQWQRGLSYGALSLSKLMSLYYDMSGLKTHVNHHSAIAKMFGQGYLVMRREELGRLVGDDN